jgi:hypothetical protein
MFTPQRSVSAYLTDKKMKKQSTPYGLGSRKATAIAVHYSSELSESFPDASHR